MLKARDEHEKQYELSDEQKRLLKQIAGKVGKIDKKKIGESGENMGFDEFKIVETCIFRLEERLLRGLKDEQRQARRSVLKVEIKDREKEG